MKKFTTYLELASRYHVFVMLNIYGLGKIAGGQFHRKNELPLEIAQQTLAEVNGFDLAWAFMGYSYAYILFIGLSQVLGAWLLLFNRTKLLGVAILVPILLNIIVFDAIFFETYGALSSALIYFTLLLVILWLNKKQVILAMKSLMDFKTYANTTTTTLLKKGVIVIIIMGSIFGIEQLLISILGH